MITEEIVDNICTSRQMKKISISKFSTWIDKNHQEGIEFQGGKLIPFWVKDGIRIYNEPVSEHVQKTIDEISKVQPEKKEKPEKNPDRKKDVIIPDNPDSILPEFLTPALMSKWAKMSTTDRVLLFQKTPQDKIEHVKVGSKNGKDVYAPYVTGNYMFREANASFLFDWYLDGIIITVGAKGVSVTGKLYAYFTEYNKYLSRPATGYQECNSQIDVELAKKGATTDAIKKGLSLFGFNSDVYSGERD